MFMNLSANKYEIIPFDPIFAKQMAENEAVSLGEEGWSENGILETVSLNGTYFIALLDGEYAGHGGFTTVLDECYITNISVKECFRKKGIGTAILKKIIDVCKQKGASFLTLEVRDSNNSAISLYQKFGFIENGRRKNFYNNPKEDAVIMTLEFR